MYVVVRCTCEHTIFWRVPGGDDLERGSVSQQESVAERQKGGGWKRALRPFSVNGH